MSVQRAGYTVVTFVVDVSQSMAKERVIEVPSVHGEPVTVDTTSLARALQFVKLKVQEMVFNGRKTDKCSVIVVGSEGTKNKLNQQGHGYDNITEYIRIIQPSSRTLAKIDKLEPSSESADVLDGLIVATEAQQEFLGNKSWTRKIVLITDGETPIERDGWEITVDRLKERNTHLTIVGVDFDEEDYFQEEGKSTTKAENEEFFHHIEEALNEGDADLCLVGNLEYALESISRPESKLVKSTLTGTVLRLGDVDGRSEEAIEITIKTAKCTAVTRPKSWKKYTKRSTEEDEDVVLDDMEIDSRPEVYALLKQRTEYTIDQGGDEEEQAPKEEDDEMDVDEEEEAEANKKKRAPVEKEELIRGYKFGTDYIPAEHEFPRLPTKKGMEIGGFFKAENFRREYSMGEVYYVWADPGQPLMQAALSSLAQAMQKEGVYAFTRWVSKDGADAKMGVLAPTFFDQVHCLLWARMPFADDVRKYAFAPLERLVNKKGDVLTEHPYLPTNDQMEAMDRFVDAMDLMEAGEKDEEGNRQPWFNTIESYNPSLHRIKQAHFHCAVVPDVATHPLPPIHPELTRFFEIPSRILNSSKKMIAIDECTKAFNVREVPKRKAGRRKDDHQHVEDDSELLIGAPRSVPVTPSKATPKKDKKPVVQPTEDSETESESDIDMPTAILQATEKKQPEAEEKKEPGPSGPSRPNLPTPERSPSPQVDAGRAHGRIIGSTYPLKDFTNNLKQGDLVTKAVEDMAAVIREIVLKPFSSKRHEELVKCMKCMRETCLNEDEIEQWNRFMKNLKEDCLGYPGNHTFWTKVQKEGVALGPISKKEARALGGTSDMSESAVAEFMA